VRHLLEHFQGDSNLGVLALQVELLLLKSAMASNKNVFLEFAFDHDLEWRSQSEAYERTWQLIRARGGEIGVDTSSEPSALDEVGKELVQSFYESDPSLMSQGPCRLEPPPPRAPSRVTIELFFDSTPKVRYHPVGYNLVSNL
jgi:hypothetical protein